MVTKKKGEKFAQIRPSMWLDDEWRDLTKDAQHLYMLLLTDPERSYCGVVDWKPARIVQRAREWSSLELMRAAAELSYSYFLVFDQETEEVMVRSFMRHDGLLTQPTLGISVANAFGVVGSNKIRAAIVHELIRLRKERPELASWDSPQMKTVLRQRSVDPKKIDVELDLPSGVLPHLPSGVPSGVPKEVDEGSRDPSHPTAPTTATATATSSKEDAPPQRGSYPQPQLRAIQGSRK